MKNMMLSQIDRISKIAGLLSAVFMVLIVILINVEIVIRTFFNRSTYIADEYSSYFLVAVVLLGLAYAAKHNCHIRVEVIRTRLSKGSRRIVDIFCLAAAIILMLYGTYHASYMAFDAYSMNITADSISETPIFLPQLMIPLGLILFVLQLIATLIRRLSNDI
jgi:TRAP-type transport system small permease protein